MRRFGDAGSLVKTTDAPNDRALRGWPPSPPRVTRWRRPSSGSRARVQVDRAARRRSGTGGAGARSHRDSASSVRPSETRSAEALACERRPAARGRPRRRRARRPIRLGRRCAGTRRARIPGRSSSAPRRGTTDKTRSSGTSSPRSSMAPRLTRGVGCRRPRARCRRSPIEITGTPSCSGEGRGLRALSRAGLPEQREANWLLSVDLPCAERVLVGVSAQAVIAWGRPMNPARRVRRT